MVVSTSEVGKEVVALTQAELSAEDLEEASMETVDPRQGNKARVSIEVALEGVKAVVSTRELGEVVAALVAVVAPENPPIQPAPKQTLS